MKTKNIAIIVILSSFVASAPCFGMDYMRSSYNSATAMVANNIMHARNWTSNFIAKCRYVGILATLYATLGIYDFNKITDLDKNKLETYTPTELENGINRLNTMAQYGASSEKLDELFDIVQKHYLIAQSKEQEKNLTPEQKAALEKIEQELTKK